jgi:hypothetical protein
VQAGVNATARPQAIVAIRGLAVAHLNDTCTSEAPPKDDDPMRRIPNLA